MARRRVVQVGPFLIRLTPAEAELVAVLLIVRPRPMTAYQIADLLYGEREDGGPANAKNNIDVVILRLRRKGVPVRHRKGYGYLI